MHSLGAPWRNVRPRGSVVAEFDELVPHLDELVPHPPAVPPPDDLVQKVIALAKAVSKPPGVPRKKNGQGIFF